MTAVATLPRSLPSAPDLSHIATADLIRELDARQAGELHAALVAGEAFCAALDVLTPEKSGQSPGIRDRAHKLYEHVIAELTTMRALDERK